MKVKPTREQAENAVRLLLEYIGEDADREGLLETPARVVRAYDEIFGGYLADPISRATHTDDGGKVVIDDADGYKTFAHGGNYNNIVALHNIPFSSHCEHHMMPMSGFVSIGYIPRDRVIGLSKLAKIVNVVSKRLNLQETMTIMIADYLQNAVDTNGIGVIVRATHTCMTMRGVKSDGYFVTKHFTGLLMDDGALRKQFINDAYAAS